MRTRAIVIPSSRQDPVAALFDRELFGIKLGLDNIRALCETLDHPELACPTVIVAGTNGKGSVSAMVAAALCAAGFRTARYTSPHLVHLEERFAIDGREVGAADLRRAARTVLDAEAAARRQGRLEVPATFFELTTAVAFELFRTFASEIAVLEVGLGGRFDATNVTSPVAGVITNIDLDHTKHLGPTLADIAFEKAGIIKPGMTVISGTRAPEAAAVITQVAAARGAMLVEAFEGVRATAELAGGRTWVELTTPARSYGRLRLALRGRHQVDNAIVAVRLLEALAPYDLEVGAAAIENGLTTAWWPARLDLRAAGDGRRVLLDVAHNPAGARALASYLAEVWPGGVPIVFGAMRDKDVASMLRALAPVATRFVFTQPATPRALPARDLLALYERSGGLPPPAVCAEGPAAAIELAFGSGDLAVVTGSVFLVGELLALAGIGPPVDG
jgi:dihydrofolate synthase/folylpolyglutamate synthase